MIFFYLVRTVIIEMFRSTSLTSPRHMLRLLSLLTSEWKDVTWPTFILLATC